jgi:y4mF family transcriptional regulator
MSALGPVLPSGNLLLAMKYTPKHIGELVKRTRKNLGVTQKELALTSGTGLRFIVDLEKGKTTCQLGKVMVVLQTMGIRIEFVPPGAAARKGS